MRIFSYGASTARGSKDIEGGGFIARLGKRLEQDGLGRAENFGIGGQTTDEMAARAKTIEANADDIAIVTLGINDVPRQPDGAPDKRVPLDRHRDNVRVILVALKDRCCVVYVTQYPVAYLDRGLDEGLVRSYVQAGHDVAADLNIDVVDIHAMIDESRFTCFIHEDGMHFNSEGHATSRVQTQRPWLSPRVQPVTRLNDHIRELYALAAAERVTILHKNQGSWHNVLNMF